MDKQTALKKLSSLERKLPYGAKAKIANEIEGKNKHAIQSVFRGLAGEDLTILVYQTAKRLFPKLAIVKRRKRTNKK